MSQVSRKRDTSVAHVRAALYAFHMPNAYDAPLKNIRSTLALAASVTGLQSIAGASESLSADVTDSVLDNAARFAREVLSPLNPVGDRTRVFEQGFGQHGYV